MINEYTSPPDFVWERQLPFFIILNSLIGIPLTDISVNAIKIAEESLSWLTMLQSELESDETNNFDYLKDVYYTLQTLTWKSGLLQPCQWVPLHKAPDACKYDNDRIRRLYPELGHIDLFEERKLEEE